MELKLIKKLQQPIKIPTYPNKHKRNLKNHIWV